MGRTRDFGWYGQLDGHGYRGEDGDVGQVGVVWFSMGVAIWQITLMARHLLFAGRSPLSLSGFPRFLDLSQPLPEDGRKQLVTSNVRDMIEMSFWTIKFLEDFEKQYAKNYRAVDGVDRSDEKEEIFGRVYGDGKIWSPNARSFLKLMRYVTKFLGTFDNYRKKNSS